MPFPATRRYYPSVKRKPAFPFIRSFTPLLVVCISSAILASGTAQTAAPGFDTQLERGIELLGEGRIPESVEAFNAAKQNAPRDSRPYFYCGMALAQAGRLQDAASELGEAVHLAPNQLDYRVFQAHVLEQLKQPFAAEQALAVFEKPQSADQLSPAWLKLLADVYYRLQKADEALKVLDLWAKHDSADAQIDLYRGQAYVVKAQPDMALACFKRSLEKSAQNPQAYFELGSILYERNQLPAARDALLNAVRQDARKPEYSSKLASVYLAMNDPDAAIESLNKVESQGPEMPMIYYTLSRAYRSKGDADRAGAYLKQFEQATSAARDREASTREAQGPVAQGQRQLEQGNPSAARALFEQALKVDADQWVPNANLAEMDLNAGNAPHAYPYLRKLEQIDPDSAVGNFLFARYWFAQKDYERARVYAEKVKLTRPGNSELRALLGDIYLELGEKQKAVAEYEEAMRLAPGRIDLRERLRKAGAEPPHPTESSRQ